MNSIQLDIYSEMYPKFTIKKPIRLIELFAGIGSQAKALKNLGADFDHWKVVEFDRHAMASYNSIHCTNFETSDIREVHAEDLDLREREILLHHDIFIPLSRFVCCRASEGHEKGLWNQEWIAMGSGADS
jgi:hypothetical protein